MSYILFLEEQLCTHRVVRLMWLCIYTIFQFSPAACLRTQRQAVRVKACSHYIKIKPNSNWFQTELD